MLRDLWKLRNYDDTHLDWNARFLPFDILYYDEIGTNFSLYILPYSIIIGNYIKR